MPTNTEAATTEISDDEARRLCRPWSAIDPNTLRIVKHAVGKDRAARFEEIRERNLRAFQHEAETPMRGHTATCCAAAAVGSA